MAADRQDLSPRELAVVRLVVDGLGNREIAVALCLSNRTVDSHVSGAMKKTGTRTRTQLAVHVLRAGIVALHEEPLPHQRCGDRGREP